jgi:hypothetical protein
VTLPRQVDLRQVDTILASFPGPVTLHQGRRKFFITFMLCLGIAAFCAYLLFARHLFGWEDEILMWAATLFFALCAIRALIQLLVPSAAGLTLDDDGFEIGGIFRRGRLAWRHVSSFHVGMGDQPGKQAVTYEVRSTGTGPHPQGVNARATRTLSADYGLPKDDLAWLMNAWRQQALAQRVVRLRH